MVETVQRDAARGYFGEVRCQASPEQVFTSIATIKGLRGWWTPIVAGVAEVGDELAFGFENLDEAIVVRVEEVTRFSRVRWTCLLHTGAPDWAGTKISFDIREEGGGGTALTLRHDGLPADQVTGGWDRFLASVALLAETGRGDPYRAEPRDALEVARAYHAAWTTRDFTAARRYLAPDLETEVPIHRYAGRDDFADAVEGFGGLAERVDLLAEFGTGQQALLLYDMHIPGLGRFRVAEHFTVKDRLIQRIRHVHDTARLPGAA